MVSNFSASATTVHSGKSMLIEELQAERKEQAAHMMHLAALVNFISSKSNGPPEKLTRDWRRGSNQNNIETQTCKNCKKNWVTHANNMCM